MKILTKYVLKPTLVCISVPLQLLGILGDTIERSLIRGLKKYET